MKLCVVPPCWCNTIISRLTDGLRDTICIWGVCIAYCANNSNSNGKRAIYNACDNHGDNDSLFMSSPRETWLKCCEWVTKVWANRLARWRYGCNFNRLCLCACKAQPKLTSFSAVCKENRIYFIYMNVELWHPKQNHADDYDCLLHWYFIIKHGVE